MTEQIGWGLNDHDFLQQMVPRLEKLQRPFCAWLITLSLHHPFEDFPDAHKILRLGARDRTSFGNYLHTMRFFDQALDDFKTALASRGLLEDTMLIVFGDHDAGFPRQPALAEAIGVGSDPVSWALNDRVPFFVRLPASAPVTEHGARAQAAGQTDFAPTLLALLGIDAAGLPYLGRNLLGAPDDPPVIRPYGDWLDRERLFLSGGGTASSCYDLAARAFADGRACAGADAAARKARDVSRFLIGEDLQRRMLVQSAPR